MARMQTGRASGKFMVEVAPSESGVASAQGQHEDLTDFEFSQEDLAEIEDSVREAVESGDLRVSQ